MYELIVLGATFAAAGIAEKHQGNCLVIERRMEAGYEFFCPHFDTDLEIYPHLQKADLLFGTDVVSVEKTEKGFSCLVHNVEGFSTFEAKRIIDTRCNARMCEAKSYDLMIVSGAAPAFPGVACKPVDQQKHYILSVPVALHCSYPEARAAALEIVKQFSSSQRLVYSAGEFNYQVKAGYPKEEKGILLAPSKAYADPAAAFNAGKELGK